MYKVYPSDQESWYDARYLVSDGATYDLENVHDIQKIPTPKFAKFDSMMDGYGITGSLDYVIRMKAGAFYNRNEKELCSACLWKSTQLMLANTAVRWKKKDFERLINCHLELGKNRRNCFAVHPPAEKVNEKGQYVRPKAIWYVGFAVLTAYHAGTYTPGDEIKFKQVYPLDDHAVDDFCRRLLADHTAQTFVKTKKKGRTFAEVYELFYEWKYGANAKKKLSDQSKRSTQAAFKNCAALHDKVFENLRHKDLQDCIDKCTLNMGFRFRMMN